MVKMLKLREQPRFLITACVVAIAAFIHLLAIYVSVVFAGQLGPAGFAIIGVIVGFWLGLLTLAIAHWFMVAHEEPKEPSA